MLWSGKKQSKRQMKDEAAAATFKLFGQTVRHQFPAASPRKDVRQDLTIATFEPTTTATAQQDTKSESEARESETDAELSSPLLKEDELLTVLRRESKTRTTVTGEATAKGTSGIDRTARCPRCESSDTKFCYFNNYSVNQPRYFCRKCQRFWTNGGSQRNLPVGSGRRKRMPKKGFNKDQGEMVEGSLYGPLSSSSSPVLNVSWSYGTKEMNMADLNHAQFSGLLMWPHDGIPRTYYCFDGEPCDVSVSSASKSGSPSTNP